MTTGDPFLDRLKRTAKIRQRIDKLLATAERHPETHEGQTARRMAEALARKLDIAPEDVPKLKPSPAANMAAFRGMTDALKRSFPGKIDASDLEPRHRTVSKEEDNDDGAEGY